MRSRRTVPEAVDRDLAGLGARLGGVERSLQALGFAVGARLERVEEDGRRSAAATLRARYAHLADAPPGHGLEDAECRVYSQNGEDGVLLHLFAAIGVTDRRFLEIGIGDGSESNTASLARHFGWRGAMVDRDPEGVAAARRLYSGLPETRRSVAVVERHVTREGVDALVTKLGLEGELDLLSIDIDGNDLWVWEALTMARPRVVVVEYNASFGPDRSVSVPYDPSFDRFAHHPSGHYHGASLVALARVGERKRYVLVGCEGNGVNAFFVRADCARGRVPAVAPERAWRPARERGPSSPEEQFRVIAGLPLEPIA